MNSVQKSLNRMSTGYKINQAKDDAAGLYIATKLNTQINGLVQARKNTQQGIAYLNIAESALNNMNDILNRLRDLAVQAANSVYDTNARDAIQAEADNLVEELTRIRESTKFNGKSIFDANANYGAVAIKAYESVTAALSQSVAENIAPPPVVKTEKTNTPQKAPIIPSTPEVKEGELEPSDTTITGVVSFAGKNETKEVLIDNITYTITNNKNGSNQISYSKDTVTGELTFLGNESKIVGQKDVAHNLIINGRDNQIYTGDLDDKVRDKGTTSTLNSFYLGKGDDNAEFNNQNHVYGEDGNDTIILHNGGSSSVVRGGNGDDYIYGVVTAYGEAGKDTLENCANAYGGDDDDYIYNCNNACGEKGNDKIESIRKKAYLYGGEGNDHFIVQAGADDNIVDGETGTNTIVDNGLNTMKMNVPGANANFVRVLAKATVETTINGKNIQ